MATGSKRYFQYRTDSGELAGVLLDESTYEVAGLGFGQALQTGDPNYIGLIRASARSPIGMRYLNMVGTDADGRQVTRRLFVGDPASAAWTDPGAFTINLITVVGGTATSTPFGVSSAIGERRAFIAPTDTGLIDGDVENTVAAGP